MNTEITLGRLRYSFAENGMLCAITLPEEFGACNLLKQPMQLKLKHSGGEELFTVSRGKAPESWKSANGAVLLDFGELGFADNSGKIVPGYRMTLRYELFDDGTAFTDAFFLGEMADKKEICGFEFSCPLNLAAFETIRWGLTYRPKKADGALIQTSAPERCLAPGADRTMEHCIFPLASFNLWSAEGPSCYAEFLMEGDNVLAGDAKNNRSSVTWEGNDPTLCWDFQTEPVLPASGPWQWRNRWGFVVAPAPQTRHYPPLPMYHYFDNTRRYPSDEALEAIAASGAEVLILHENWRTDVQNDGHPYDPLRFREVIDFAHRHNIRVMVYVRGNENSLEEECCDWFAHYLKRDYDGLYMDYGGPFHYQVPANEIFQGGRILFRKHYLELQKYRRIVGKDGLFYSHTGAMFSALGITGGNIDGYVSGEGERGLLVRSRLDHSYYAMSTVSSGTMWTAAFPEYSTPVMTPYLASAGQTPHVPLGVQFPSSSLAHPPVPGIGDLCFRPLWKLWQLLQGSSNLQVLNDYNCRGIFARSEEVAHYFMSDGKTAVCIFANLTGVAVSVNARLDEAKLPLPAEKKKFLCLPDIQTPGKVRPFDAKEFVLAPHGIGAVVWGKTDFTAYEKPYPELSPTGRKYQEYVAQQRKFRAGQGANPEWFIKVSVQDLPVPYEESMIVDLYDNRFELLEQKGTELYRLGFLGKNGFQKEETKQSEFVMNGCTSPWIPLRALLGSGKHDLVIKSLHRGDFYYVNTPFYSFLDLDVAKTPQEPGYRICFLNELEPDRSLLHFSVELSE